MAQSNGDTPRELFLIDGNSLAYRAFFALPESIATSDGRPTNAIFGFASMLVKILTDYGPVPTVVVWDAGMSGRKEISPDYKAQRTSRPERLRGDELVLVASPPDVPEGELLPAETSWRFAAYAGGGHAIVGSVDDPAQ